MKIPTENAQDKLALRTTFSGIAPLGLDILTKISKNICYLFPIVRPQRTFVSLCPRKRTFFVYGTMGWLAAPGDVSPFGG